MKDVKVLIGNYGSGKSELALNFAMQAAARGDRTELIDLDMVNTYFRLTERGKLVEQKEIRLISPNFACSGIETLSLPAEVASAFALDWDSVIFDVGGDDVGATALGRYHRDFAALPEGALEVLNVVNIRRPLASTLEKVLHLQEGMQTHARLRITGMINNTNLSTMTSAADLWDGYELLREVADRTGIPVAYTTGKKEFLEAFLAKSPTRPTWEGPSPSTCICTAIGTPTLPTASTPSIQTGRCTDLFLFGITPSSGVKHIAWREQQSIKKRGAIE